MSDCQSILSTNNSKENVWTYSKYRYLWQQKLKMKREIFVLFWKAVDNPLKIKLARKNNSINMLKFDILINVTNPHGFATNCVLYSYRKYYIILYKFTLFSMYIWGTALFKQDTIETLSVILYILYGVL